MIIPIATPSIDWTKYLLTCQQVLGRSLTEQLDSQRMPTNTLSAFLATLGNLRDPDLKPRETLAAPGSLLNHLTFSFLIVMNEYHYVSLGETCNGIAFLSVETIRAGTRLAIASGALSAWRESIINSCSKLTTFEVRLLFDELLLYFEHIGLEQLFQAYKKVALADRTFALELK